MKPSCTRISAALISALFAGAVSAAPVIVRTQLYTDVIGPSSTFSVAAGNYLHPDTTVTSAFFPPQLTAVISYSLDSSIVRSLDFYTGPIFAERNFDRFLTNVTLTSAWNLRVTDPTGFTDGVLKAIADPGLLPLVLNLHVIQGGDTPTVAWDLPDLSAYDVDRIRVRAVTSAGIQIFQSASLPTSTTSYTIPDGILTLGESYEFRVMLDDLINDPNNETPILENRSNTFTGLVALVPEPSGIAVLGVALAGLLRLGRNDKKSGRRV